jgi:hypothetical protein
MSMYVGMEQGDRRKGCSIEATLVYYLDPFYLLSVSMASDRVKSHLHTNWSRR